MDRSKAKDNGKREEMQTASDRAKKNRKVNYEGGSGGEEEYYVAPSSVKRGCGSVSGDDSDKVSSKRSREIAKSRRGEKSSNSKNGSKHNSGGRTLQVKGRG